MRRQVMRELNSLSAAEKQQKSAIIQIQLQEKLKNQSGLWTAFQPMSTEPQIKWKDISANIQWCFPIVENDKMSFKKKVTQFSFHPMGFMEPIDGESVALEGLKGFIVPGLAFDPQGNRLGRGRGFYDSTLKNLKNPLTIGVCFHTAFKKSVPVEEHDLKCQLVITENQSVVIEGVHQWN